MHSYTGKPDEVMLVIQFRPPVNKMCVEVPSGMMDPGEDVQKTGTRELLEETGLTVARFL
jgi:ADP-ribose pyrophosphatase